MEIIDTLQQEEFEAIINSVLEKHDDLTYYDVEEVCQDFLDEIPKKIKEVTKLKRLKKYITKEFELDKDISNIGSKKTSEQQSDNSSDEDYYCLENIPKYLFEGKTKIASNLIHVKNLTANI